MLTRVYSRYVIAKLTELVKSYPRITGSELNDGFLQSYESCSRASHWLLCSCCSSAGAGAGADAASCWGQRYFSLLITRIATALTHSKGARISRFLAVRRLSQHAKGSSVIDLQFGFYRYQSDLCRYQYQRTTTVDT